LQAQNLIQGTDVGIHVFGTRPDIQVRDSRMGTLVHAYLRRQLGERTQQELNIGMGLIQGVDFKTRILPIDYRVLAFPFSYSKGQFFPGLHYGDLYAYAGLGIVNSTPIEIPRPDDPLTIDAGATLRGSSFLDLTTNWSVHIPVGVGTSIHLDDETQMVFNAGYHLSPANAFSGYFGMSVGLKFNKPFRPRRAVAGPHYPFPSTTGAILSVAAPVAKTPAVAEVFEPGMVYFESSMSTVRDSETQTLDEAVAFLERNPRLEIVLRAHADSSGHPDVNRILAEDRAWKTAVELMRRGVEPDRIRTESFGDQRPALDNRTVEGRAMNRRLEVAMRPRTAESTSSDDVAVISPASLPDNGVVTLADYSASLDLTPGDSSRALILAVATWLNDHPEAILRILSMHDFGGSELTKRLLATAQASHIQRLLIEQGVDVSRIETEGVAGGPRRTELLRVPESR
jgi:outer membrane protein OmpA-like peptidoglycan-associated protein